MTKEEKKAIYSFNEWIEISEKGRLDYFQIIDKDIEDMRTVLNLIQNLQEENKKKDKVIDLMAGHITDGSVMKTYKEICKNVSGEMDCIYTPIDKVNCVDCIKQYFKKVSDGE